MIVASLCCILPRKTQRFTSTLLLLIMMFMCGMRAYDVGADTHNYVDYITFLNLDDYKWGPLFVLMRSAALLFDNSQTAFLMIMAIFTYLPLIVLVRKNSFYPALSVLMYIIPVGIFFNESFNIARQSIAIIYVLIGALCVEKHNKTMSLFFLVLAFLFHPYTFISFPIIFFDKINLSKEFVYIILIVSAIIGIAGAMTGIQEGLNLLMLATQDSSSELVVRLSKYGEADNINSGFSLVGQFSHILPLLLLCALGANNKTLNNTYYKMMLFGCVITNIFVSVIYCERIASTYTIAQILAVPYIYKMGNKNTKILLVVLLVGTALLYVYNLNGYSTLPAWTPYHTFFN